MQDNVTMNVENFAGNSNMKHVILLIATCEIKIAINSREST